MRFELDERCTSSSSLVSNCSVCRASPHILVQASRRTVTFRGIVLLDELKKQDRELRRSERELAREDMKLERQEKQIVSRLLTESSINRSPSEADNRCVNALLFRSWKSRKRPNLVRTARVERTPSNLFKCENNEKERDRRRRR